jgi:predicted PurR-regulated permease PerM
MKRLAGHTAVVLATLALLYLLWQFRLIVVLFVVSLFVAAAVRPSIIHLTHYKLSPLVARLLVYSLLIAAFIFLSYLLSEPLSREVQLLSNHTAVTYQIRYSQWSTGTEWQQGLVSRLPDPAALFDTAVGEEGEQLLQTVLNITQAMFTVLGGAITVIILSIYWSADQDRFERLWLSLLPAARRIRARDGWRELETNVSDYLRNQFVQSLLAASLLGLGYWLMGLEYPILLSLVAAIAWLIPLAGVVLIAVPVFFVGFNVSLLLGVAALLYTIVIILVLEIAVEPRLFDRRRYSTFLLLLTMICLVDAIGFVGFLIAPPLAAALQIVVGQIFRYTIEPETTAVPAHQLEQRYQAIRQLLQDNGPPPPQNGRFERSRGGVGAQSAPGSA